MVAKRSAAMRCMRPVERRGPRHRHHRRAHDPGIDKLALGEPFAVGIAARRDRAVLERNEVGGRGADIDEQCVGQQLSDQRRARMPIGRGHLRASAARLRIEKARPAPLEQASPVVTRRIIVDQIGDALGPVGEHVGQLAGHGDGMHGLRRASGSASSSAASNLLALPGAGRGFARHARRGLPRCGRASDWRRPDPSRRPRSFCPLVIPARPESSDHRFGHFPSAELTGLPGQSRAMTVVE